MKWKLVEIGIVVIIDVILIRAPEKHHKSILMLLDDLLPTMPFISHVFLFLLLLLLLLLRDWLLFLLKTLRSLDFLDGSSGIDRTAELTTLPLFLLCALPLDLFFLLLQPSLVVAVLRVSRIF